MDSEWFKTVRTAHSLVVAVSLTGLVLLFAPSNTEFSGALEEAITLRDLQLQGYERYARGPIGSPLFLPKTTDHPTYAGTEIVRFLESLGVCCLAPIPTDDWEVLPALDYDPPPVEKPLSEWLNWMSSTVPASFWLPDWSQAFVSVDTRELLRREDHGPRTLRFFSVAPESMDVWRRPRYRFRAFLEDGLKEGAGETWWKTFASVPSRQLWDQKGVRSLEQEGRSVVEGFADALERRSVVEESVSTGSVNAWLRSDAAATALFSQASSSPIGLPRIREHWTSLSSMPLPEAIAFMENKQKEIHEVSLLGLAIPGDLCLAAIPLAYLLTVLYFFLHVLALRKVVEVKSEMFADDFPWMGLYAGHLPRFVTKASLTALPALLAVGLIVRYSSRADTYTVWTAVLSGGVALILGSIASAEVTRVRKLLTGLPHNTRLERTADAARSAE